MNEAGASAPKGLDYVLGSLDARVTLLERGMKDMQREIKDDLHAISVKSDKQSDKIDKLTQEMVSSRSSWKTIGWFVGLIAALSTLAMTLHQLGLIR